MGEGQSVVRQTGRRRTNSLTVISRVPSFNAEMEHGFIRGLHWQGTGECRSHSVWQGTVWVQF
jgi:hypothetical protein